jgi:DNA (cytosine-5)-methyltransferase 1
LKKYSILSVFTGAGGLDLGFHGGFEYLHTVCEELPFYTKTAIEIDSDACETIKHNNLAENVINDDIRNVNLNSLGYHDVVIGGFPCLTFSMAGGRARIKDDLNGQLYDSLAKTIEVVKPKIFLAENVKGVLSANGGEAIKVITERFENVGYNVSVKLVDFSKLGVPQKRERVLFIGIAKEYNIMPNIYTMDLSLVTAEYALSGVENSEYNNEYHTINLLTQKRIDAIPEGGNHTNLPVDLAIKALMSNIYRRLDRYKPSPTILASGGGGTLGYHYSEPRPLTNRERARLQSFPDIFVFKGGMASVRRQIGNAVPPVGIYKFAIAIAGILNDIENGVNVTINGVKVNFKLIKSIDMWNIFINSDDEYKKLFIAKEQYGGEWYDCVISNGSDVFEAYDEQNSMYGAGYKMSYPGLHFLSEHKFTPMTSYSQFSSGVFVNDKLVKYICGLEAVVEYGGVEYSKEEFIKKALFDRLTDIFKALNINVANFSVLNLNKVLLNGVREMSLIKFICSVFANNNINLNLPRDYILEWVTTFYIPVIGFNPMVNEIISIPDVYNLSYKETCLTDVDELEHRLSDLYRGKYIKFYGLFVKGVLLARVMVYHGKPTNGYGLNKVFVRFLYKHLEKSDIITTGQVKITDVKEVKLLDEAMGYYPEAFEEVQGNLENGYTIEYYKNKRNK